ncbi:2-dehydro-3-deoxygalactonokinase [uncultured Salipiger sp.]|uniref:2-dehydro-3-deoxygalactonokinase n=1 Tax=uncultured Salipiger sp. TaxID=499810 RepID=UPI002595AFDF|nr:2-dehydro-3-deoxygalactonokinase [uncultured Salipiger sp.]
MNRTDANALDWASVSWVAAERTLATLRVWALSAGGTVLAKVESGEGPGATDDLAAVLDRLLPGRPADVPVLVSGAGQMPAPAVPCKPPLRDAAQAAQGLLRLPGVAQQKPVDLLEGEETRVAGFLALNPRFDGVLCLPGPRQTRWVHVSAGEIVSFRSFLTGALFAMLRDLEGLSDGWDEAAFLEAVDHAMGRPAGVAGDLATVLAELRLAGLDPAAASSRALGLLLGMELAAAKPYWLGQSVALVDEANAARPWQAALTAQAVPVVLADGTRLALEGLKAAYKGP